MSDYRMPADEARGMIDDILSWRPDKLTAWENDFLDSIDEWEGELTPKQTKTLNKIYDKIMD